jgi:hypothetical protein
MLCYVGGRERTADHYSRLLTQAGFTLLTPSDLRACQRGIAVRRHRADARPPSRHRRAKI